MRVTIVLLAWALLGAGGAALAQDYPARALRFIVPFPPGGGTDLISRVIGRKLNERWGQPVVIENRGGANGVIGAELAARAPADGHTLAMIISTHTVLPSWKRDLPYDLLRDFAAVIHVAEVPNIVVAHPALPVRSIRDLIELGRKRPGQLNYAGAGTGGPSHLAGELFGHLAGVKMSQIPYKGTGPAMADLLGGHVDLMFATTPGALPHVRAGKLRGLAVTGASRSPIAPELPTVAEAGVKDYEFVSWYGIVVRAGSPAQAIERLHAEIASILGADDVRQLLTDQGAQATARGPREFDAYLRSETKRWAKMIAEMRIRLE
jgi:tripartite-type tricarboxylate transporter receptor subunit TctC